MTKACLCALAISLVTTGCSDLLDKEPPSAISDGSFWTGEGDAMLALTGCYRFQTGWSHDDFATPQGLLYLDFAGGNGTEKENFSTLMASSNTVATNGNLRWYWGNAYTQIAKYNTFLENITDCPMEESKKEQPGSFHRLLHSHRQCFRPCRLHHHHSLNCLTSCSLWQRLPVPLLQLRPLLPAPE